MPSEEVSSYNEVKFWLDMSWIKIFNKEEKTMNEAFKFLKEKYINKFCIYY